MRRFMPPGLFVRIAAALAGALLVAGCTPQQALLASVLPPGTASVLLSNLERVDDANQTRVAELEARGDWEGLAKLADENLARQPSNAAWWLVSGYANTRLERHARAAQSYGEAVRLEPDDAAGWHLLAQSHRAMRQPERAITVLNRALLVLREAPVTHYMLGESYGDLGRYPAAAAEYRKALRLEPRFSHAWYGLGYAELRNGREAEARAAVKALEALDPEMAAALARLVAAPRR